MTAKLTPNLRVRNAKDFLENLVNHPITPPQTSADGSHKVDRSHYLFIGRTKAWPTNLLSNPVVSETSPPTPKNTRAEDLEAREQMIALKKIRAEDATLSVRRYNWDSSGLTIYQPYSVTDENLFNHPTQDEIEAANIAGSYKAGSLYVVTDQYHIFKCLSNGGGAKSTVKPTLPLSPPYVVNTVDGYSWKYMATLSNFQSQYFFTNQWLPVKTLTVDDGSNQWDVQASAVEGSIDSYIVQDGGNGYTNVISASLTGATANTGTLPVVPEIALVDGAYVGCDVWVTGGPGFPSGPFLCTAYVAATRQFTINGAWAASGGTQVQILPHATITGDGSGASAKVTVDTLTGKVNFVIPTNVGSDYGFASVAITGGTTGTPATVIAQMSPSGGHGKDIEKELNACFAQLTARLPYDDGSGDIPLANDYRQVGIIRDVLQPDGLTLANDTTLRASKGISLINVSTGVGGAFQPDELIIGTDGFTTTQARIISFITGPGPTDATIHYYQDSTTGFTPFADGFAITGSVTGASANIPTGGLISSEIDLQSGDILYIDNKRPTNREINQTEILRAVIKF